MKRVLVCSPKGGVGKTHLARNLSVAAAHAGLRVATADFDPQEALTRSWQRRPVGLAAPTHYPVSWADAEALVSPGGIEEADILFIDTPPSLHEHQDDMRTLAVIYDESPTSLAERFISWGVLNPDATGAIEEDAAAAQ